MSFGVIVTTLSLGLTAALASTTSDTAATESQRALGTLAQARPDAASGASTTNLQGTGLTPSHKQIIYDNIAGEQAQTLSGNPSLAVGDTIPDSLMLNTMPIAVKDQIGLLKDFKFVKLTGDNILIVDPASRKIVDIITKQEAGR
jgi:hypothetical protein